MATVTLGGTLSEKFQAIAAAGFDGVELMENDLKAFAGTARQARSIAKSLGLEILMFQPLRNFEGCPREYMQQNVDRAERMFDVMGDLGAKILLVCSNVADNASPCAETMVEDLHRLAERAAVHGLKIGYEALSWGRHVRSYRDAWRLVEAAAHPNLGLVLDSFHVFSIKDDVSGLSRIPSEQICFVQLADAHKMTLDIVQWSRRFRCFPGRGAFNLLDFLTPIMRNGYSGPLSLEIFSDTYPLLSPKLVAHNGFQSLLYLEKTAMHVAAHLKLATA